MRGMIAMVSWGLLASSALADGMVYEFDSSGSPIGTGESVVAGTDETITLDPNTRYVDIIPDSSSDDIPELTFKEGPSGGRVKIYIGADTTPGTYDFVDSGAAPTNGGRDLKGIIARYTNNASTGLLCESEWYGGITRHFGSTTNPNDYNIDVDRLVRFDVGGNLHGNIAAQNPGGTATARFIVEANTILDDCEIRLIYGDITRVKTTGTPPNMLCNTAGAGDLKAPCHRCRRSSPPSVLLSLRSVIRPPRSTPPAVVHGKPFGADGEPFVPKGLPSMTKGSPSTTKGRPFATDGEPTRAKGSPTTTKGEPFGTDGEPSGAKGRALIATVRGNFAAPAAGRPAGQR